MGLQDRFDHELCSQSLLLPLKYIIIWRERFTYYHNVSSKTMVRQYNSSQTSFPHQYLPRNTTYSVRVHENIIIKIIYNYIDLHENIFSRCQDLQRYHFVQLNAGMKKLLSRPFRLSLITKTTNCMIIFLRPSLECTEWNKGQFFTSTGHEWRIIGVTIYRKF